MSSLSWITPELVAAVKASQAGVPAGASQAERQAAARAWVERQQPGLKTIPSVHDIHTQIGRELYKPPELKPKDLVKLPDGHMLKYDYQRLSPEDRAAAKGGGFVALDQLHSKNLDADFTRLVRIEGSWQVANTDLPTSTGGRFSDLQREFGKLDTQAKADLVVKMSERAIPGVKPSRDIVGKTLATTAAIRKQVSTPVGAAEVIIPGLYLGRHWGELKAWEKGVGIPLDLATFIPGVVFASAARRAGASTIGALVQKAIAELKSPITTIRHPIKTAKSVIYPVETAIRPTKLPITAAEIQETTVRLPIKTVGTPKQTKEARDILTSLAVRGEGATVDVGGKRIALTPTALGQTVQGVAVHATPDIRPFLHGATIQAGREGGVFLSPTLHSRFARASAFGDLPTGGIPGAVVITDPKILGKLKPSGKIYRGTAEIEKVLETGQKLPMPSQLLMTRTPDGQKLTLAIIGPKLSKAQIAKLKILGAKDLVRDIFVSPFKVSKAATREFDYLVETGQKIQALKKELSVARKAKRTSEITRIEGRIATLETRGRAVAKRISVRAAGREPIRPAGLSYGRGLLEITFRDYATKDPAGLARILRGMPAKGREQVLRLLTDKQATNIVERVKQTREDKAPPAYVGIPEMWRGTPAGEPERGRPPRKEPPPPRRPPPVREPSVGVTRIPPREPPPRIPPPEVPPRIPPRVPPPDIPTRVPPPPVAPPILPRLPGEKGIALTLAQRKGAIGWKQGFIYKAIYPPYGEGDIINSRERIPGIKYVSGAKSAFLSIARITKGRIPPALARDMGIMDIRISTPEGGRPRIKFKADPKQKTRLTPAGAGRLA